MKKFILLLLFTVTNLAYSQWTKQDIEEVLAPYEGYEITISWIKEGNTINEPYTREYFREVLFVTREESLMLQYSFEFKNKGKRMIYYRDIYALEGEMNDDGKYSLSIWMNKSR